MLNPVLFKNFNKKKYILDEIKDAVAIYSLDKLTKKATSPCTIRFSTAIPNFVVPFANNTFDKVAVQNYITANGGNFATTSAYIQQWTDQSNDKFATLVNLLGINGNFGVDSNSDGLADGCSLTTATASLANNEQAVTASAGGGGLSISIPSTIVGNVYYACAYIKSTTVVTMQSATGSATTGGTNTFEFKSLTMTATSTGHGFNIKDFNSSNWQQFKVKQAYFLNLTAIFGSGNEPTKANMDTFMQTKLYFISDSSWLLPQNHAIQNTANNQPRILNNGVWETDSNGKLAIQTVAINDTYLIVNNSNSLNLTNKFSILFIHAPATLGENNLGRILDKVSHYTIAVAADNTFNPANTYSASNSSANAFDLNTNNINSIIYDRLANTTKYYKNGILNSTTATNSITSNTNNLYIFSNQFINRQYDGKLSELIIFNKTLTDFERKKLEKNQGRRYNIVVT